MSTYLGYTEKKITIHWFHLDNHGTKYGVEIAGDNVRYLDQRLLTLDETFPVHQRIIHTLKEAMRNTGRGES